MVRVSPHPGGPGSYLRATSWLSKAKIKGKKVTAERAAILEKVDPFIRSEVRTEQPGVASDGNPQ